MTGQPGIFLKRTGSDEVIVAVPRLMPEDNTRMGKAT